MDEVTLKKSRSKLRHRAKRLSGQLHRVRALIRRRNKQIHNLPGSARVAVQWALDQVGTVESPPGSNSGPKISNWIRLGGGQVGWPWCQYFCDAVLVHGNGRQLKTGYTVAVIQMARRGENGFKTVSLKDAQPGDWVYFKFPGVSNAEADHVGVYVGKGKTVEGNTSPGTGGSQNNGGGVFLRVRPASLVAAVVRPPYGRPQ